MKERESIYISGIENGDRLESRVLEERIQAAVKAGHRTLRVRAHGQHGIGGRLWKAGDDPVEVIVEGHSGQRLGSLGYPNTIIRVLGPASDDVGWLNAGATIVVCGNAGNGACNGMAQGIVYVDGSIGSRGMTMTKSNPRFDQPELWVRGSVGDYFGEFMAGGISVILGVDAQDPGNVLGYRPLVGMVGGTIYFRGQEKGYSTADAKEIPLSDDAWNWLSNGLKTFLSKIGKEELLDTVSVRNDWRCITAKSPQEKSGGTRRSMTEFHQQVWDADLGRGGLVGDLIGNQDMSPVPLITTGNLRRFVPVWENNTYTAPCQSACPSGIPVQERWRLIREGRIDEAVDLALEYSPFPATVCGYLCPNLCMDACTRCSENLPPVDIKLLGKASIKANLPMVPDASGSRVAIVGGGPAGISAAWQLRRKGHEAVIFDTAEILGGKMTSVIPESRIPKEVLTAEIERMRELIPHEKMADQPDTAFIEKLKADYDYVVVATGTQKPRILPVPGKERQITSLDFLEATKANTANPGKNVVVIGAGNVGCDVATEAVRLGAESVTLIDVQQPAAFGTEKEEAEAAGAVFKWPCFTKEITEKGVLLESGELLPADSVVVAIGDAADLSFLPESIELDGNRVKVDAFYRTTDPTVFAIGDIVAPGLLTDAIGAGRKAAETITDLLANRPPSAESLPDRIDISRMTPAYFDPRRTEFSEMGECGAECFSCGSCRDCGICVTICPQGAISRKADGESGFEYVVNGDICIGCGFCAGACPCGIWALTPNAPLDELEG